MTVFCFHLPDTMIREGSIRQCSGKHSLPARYLLEAVLAPKRQWGIEVHLSHTSVEVDHISTGLGEAHIHI